MDLMNAVLLTFLLPLLLVFLPYSLPPLPSVNNNWVSRQRRHLNFKFNCNFSLSLSLSFGCDLSFDCNLKLIFIIAFFDVSQKM